eukprot:TRINITY_DN28685_c0_g1_i1.p1 TRINITY_DN28685_c0_g1~~TRINITY_DN28685_c0_g1_i1.p1  ORF type:complete len:489 (+),score=74.84 TRINITY_DN28685_c0_g1_i1:73-1467(+)
MPRRGGGTQRRGPKTGPEVRSTGHFGTVAAGVASVAAVGACLLAHQSGWARPGDILGGREEARSRSTGEGADYWGLAVRREQLLQMASAGGAAEAATRAELGELEQRMRRPAAALEQHSAALRLLRAAGDLAGAATALAAVAGVLRDLGRYSEALAHVEEAARTPGLPPAAAAILAELLATVHDCAGDPVMALHSFEQAVRLRGARDLPPRSALLHADYLRRAVAAEPAPPQQVRDAMGAKIARIVAGLVAAGPWRNPAQLPAHYVPGLTARPFHDLATDWPQLLPAAAVLEQGTGELREEFAALAADGALGADSECISAGHGSWRRFEVIAPWQEPAPGTGCAAAAPAACALLDRLAALGGFVVIRAGYSAVGPSSWLRPHYGTTNGQLKLHLGVIVPPGGCARIRVADETRRWEQGRILMLDDSFEHEVWNECSETRVVFQVVIAHPELSIPDAAVLGSDGH